LRQAFTHNLGYTLKNIRKSLALSQADIGNNDLSVRTISNIETGKSTPTLSTVLSLLENMQTTIDEIFIITLCHSKEVSLKFIRTYDIHTMLITDDYSSLKKHIAWMKKFITFYPLTQQLKLIHFSYIMYYYKLLHLEYTQDIQTLLTQLLSFTTLKKRYKPDEVDIEVISLFLQISTSTQKKKFLLDQLLSLPHYREHVRIKQAIAFYYYKIENWHEVNSIAQQALQQAKDTHHYESIVPLAGMLSVALFKTHAPNHSLPLFNFALEYATMLNQQYYLRELLRAATTYNMPIDATYRTLILLNDE
jgi:DNA-binding XRE family transcriptional regulator